MRKDIFNRDWLSYFKLAVTQARDARLKGEMDRACHLDQVVERYYAEGEAHGFNKDELFTIDSDIRNATGVPQ